MKAVNTVRINAYAKLNLTLDIKGKQGGYHMLDSLVTTVDVFDRIVLKRRKDGLVRVTMRGLGSEEIFPENNNAQRAGDAFVQAFSSRGADITIYKNIPLASGMGGSSADIAGVIAGMGRLYDVTDMGAMKALADGLGSDAGYLLTGGLARIRGRGEQVEPLPFVPMHFLLFLPERRVSTQACYARFDEMAGTGSNRTGEAARALQGGNVGWAARLFGNDLYPAACEIEPAVREACSAAAGFSPLGSSMTGSGAAAFACFESRELCEWAKSRYRGPCRTLVTRSADPRAPRTVASPFSLGDGEQA